MLEKQKAHPVFTHEFLGQVEVRSASHDFFFGGVVRGTI